MPASSVAAIPVAAPAVAQAHFAARLSLETDCTDVHEAFVSGQPDFVLFDVRGPKAYARSHVPGALNLPHREITPERMSVWPDSTLFVVYCAGPHCNGADRGALRLAQLGRSVKLMLGGMTGWADEGFPFAEGTEPGSLEILSAA
ncbi:rhodanese-like domain-containing protein [Microvirga terrestris]|uniref:Rhodanese-like domain-containing protein n=1 Tax=Microvirga terrestris TaxID=2791024 RepID=A0ABS0HP63_9HYPH|nr:rhodanese-like domain-containing protein [Microvirga terrestris]MBF9195269.1 rhodanese-like domain-containing protein [Microvirga terrestris]